MTHPLSLRTLVVVGAGGAIGSLARYGLVTVFPVAVGTFPTTTFVVNVTGAFLLAFVLETLVRRATPDHWLRYFFGVGVLGAFTTFSTLATELALLGRADRWGVAGAYAAASVVAGVAAVWLGLTLAGYRRGPVPDEGES